jgi:hypothetical protein
MDESLCYIKPVMSLDATHLKSKYKGTMYLSMVDMGLNEIYAVALSIERTYEGYDILDKSSKSLYYVGDGSSFITTMPIFICYTRDKGLVQA